MSVELAAIHVQQATRVSCVAACVCMVRRRRGDLIDEQALLEEWGSGGPFALTAHARDLGDPDYPAGYINPLARSSRGLLRSVLRDGRWVVISIVPLPHPNAQHAVVLIHLNEDDQFLYLDLERRCMCSRALSLKTSWSRSGRGSSSSACRLTETSV